MSQEQQDTFSTIDFEKEIESAAMGDLLDKFASSELSDAIDLVMLGPSAAEAGQPGYGFARYAARLFSEVGASRIRSIAAAHPIDVVRLSNTGTFWLRYPNTALSEEEECIVLAAEAAMNRLLFIKESFDIKPDITFFTEEDCSQVDAIITDTVASIAPALLKGAESNPLCSIGDAEGARGGEWDVRTRFALAAESLRLPYRLAYAFDCNVAEGLFSIDYMVPLPEWMARSRYDQSTSSWMDVSGGAKRAAGRYALAVGAVLAAVAFGTSVGIRRVRISSHPGPWGSEASMELYVDRLSFVSDILPHIEKPGEAWMGTMLDTVRLSDDAFASSMLANHCDPALDERLLPESLQHLLCATHVRDLDVLSDIESDPWDSIRAAGADREDSPMAAIAVLEEVASAADAAVAGLPDGARALYCEDGASRVAVSLADIPAAAQYVRYSDAGYTARSMLCDLYRNMHEPQRAYLTAKRCIELAPTSATGYIDASNALLDQNRFEQAVPYLEKALMFATQHSTIAFVYYRLAFALWQSGRPRPGLACYVLSLRYGYARPDAINREIGALLSDMGHIPEEDHDPVFSPAEAVEVLQEEGIATAPSAKLRNIVAKVAVSLVDAGVLDAAAPLVFSLGSLMPYRDELFAVHSSLRASAEPQL